MKRIPQPPAPPDPSLRHQTLDLVALLTALAAATAVFVLAGPEAFAAVTTTAVALFTTWRGHRPD
jgi:hypothetical protein